MDATFALGELETGPGFGEVKAAAGGMQQRKMLLSDGSDLETLSLFLDEMEQLDLEALMSFGTSLRPPSSPQAFAAANATAPPVRNKKLSSTERRKRDKEQLLERLVQLQLQLQGLETEQLQINAQYDLERQRQQCETLRVLDTNLRIRQALTREQSRAIEMFTLLNQLKGSTQVINWLYWLQKQRASWLISKSFRNLQAFTYSDADRISETAQDGPIFDMLRRNLSENYVRLAPDWENGSIPFATNEALDVSTNPDGNAIIFKSARLLPFSISRISDTLWRVAQTGFQADSFKTVSWMNRLLELIHLLTCVT